MWGGVQSLMARNSLLEMLFLFLIVIGGSDASLRWELRRLVGVDPKVNNSANGIHVKFSSFFSVLCFLALNYFSLFFFGKIDEG